MGNIEEIAEYARTNKIVLVEDCAQSLGAIKSGKHCGTFGDYGCYSFHTQKNITTLGEGGMIVVKDDEVAKKIKGLRHNGAQPFKDQECYWKPAMTNIALNIESSWPHNFSMNEAQAAVGNISIKRLDQLTKDRRKRAHRFIQEFLSYNELKFQKIS